MERYRGVMIHEQTFERRMRAQPSLVSLLTANLDVENPVAGSKILHAICEGTL